MHIGKVLKECKFTELDACGGFSARGEYTLDFLKNIHPMQVINYRISIPIFEIKYEYLTNRGNNRIGTKYYFGNLGDNPEGWEIMGQVYLDRWVSSYNADHPYRSVENVQILSAELIANANLFLQ